MIALRKLKILSINSALLMGFLFLLMGQANGHENLKHRDTVKMISIPSGHFLMGSPTLKGRADEKPQRKIFIDAFSIDAYEVTNERYLNFIHSTGRKEPPNPYSDGLLSNEKNIEKIPVVQVTWYDAVDYCRWAGKRLPTEAEWEKAARGINGFIYPWGNNEPTHLKVNFEKNWSGTKTLWPVGSNPATDSPFGVHDMAGNVREWVKDWYAPDYYQTGPTRIPPGPEEGILKVIKGGSWHSFKGDIRPASRGKGGFALKTDGIGFRCVQPETKN